MFVFIQTWSMNVTFLYVPLLENTLILEFSLPEGFTNGSLDRLCLHACNYFAVYSSSFNPDAWL